MLKASWNINLGGSNFNVILKHSVFTGRKIVYVNKSKVLNSKLFDTNNELSFMVGREKASVTIKDENLKFNYRLNVEGTERPMPMETKPSLPIPNWAYVFILLCLLIPILTPEGLVPQITGLLGALKCASVSKRADKTPKYRVRYCLILVIALWCFILAFSYALEKFVALFY